jgi:hypothetical protein
LAAIAALPARAGSPYATKRYEIAFSDGWQPMPAMPGNDSTLALMYGYSMMGYCYLTDGMEGDPATSGRFDAFRTPFGGGDSLAKVAEETVNLGGRAFTMAEYASTDSANAETRFRYYATTDGSRSFAAALIYDINSGNTLVPDFETALGTLSFATTPIRAWSRRSGHGLKPAGTDILGRPNTGTVRTAAFLLPSRQEPPSGY